MNGQKRPGLLIMRGRRELLEQLLQLHSRQHRLTLILSEKLLLIQEFWKSAREPDNGHGVMRIFNTQQGKPMDANLNDYEPYPRTSGKNTSYRYCNKYKLMIVTGQCLHPMKPNAG